ncbi:MAG: hypothetical protein FJ265_10955 [Planctomycetes bacterium]|nr:hypothetical protein [Planctomycetota bacterium]
MARPLPDPVLFLDECIGTTDVADAFRSIGVKTECLVDHFPSGTKDEVWLPTVGANEWAVLTKDKWIRKRDVERRALEDAKVAAFVLTAGNLNGSEMAAAFVKAHRRIRKTLRDHEPPFIASVTANGDVSMLTDPPRRGGKKQVL